MTREIRKTRACDGLCCKVSPLRPIRDVDSPTGQTCFFFDPDFRDSDRTAGGCTVMTDPTRRDEMTREERVYFQEQCLDWPEDADLSTQRDFTNCCWDWAN